MYFCVILLAQFLWFGEASTNLDTCLYYTYHKYYIVNVLIDVLTAFEVN